jgi:UDP-N-acetyl-D-mannosaminuronic acid dehydrogenase
MVMLASVLSTPLVTTYIESRVMHKTVCVVGLGYIGLPTALLIANEGINTIGFDVDSTKIHSLEKGKLFFEEHGLSELFASVVAKHSFVPTLNPQSADIYIIAVPTPVAKGTADLKYVFSALEKIRPYFKENALIIVESTVGPRDCVDVIIPAIKKWQKPFLFAHCPERAIPGNTLYEMVHNDRIIGGIDQESQKVTQELYAQFVKGKLHLTDVTTAAACKVMENTYRSTNIALANEFAQLAESVGFSVWEAIELANKHPRVMIHQPGPGVGGHCIPIDPWFFVTSDNANGIIERGLLINEEMPSKVVRAVEKLIIQHALKKPIIGILGYAYKKNVDDARETPAEKIILQLEKNYTTLVHDPFILDTKFVDLAELQEKANILILVTNHDQFSNLDFSTFKKLSFIYDTRNVLSNKNVKNTQTLMYTLGDGKP